MTSVHSRAMPIFAGCADRPGLRTSSRSKLLHLLDTTYLETLPAQHPFSDSRAGCELRLDIPCNHVRPKLCRVQPRPFAARSRYATSAISSMRVEFPS